MSFEAIAPHYRWLERVTAGRLLQRCRTQFIHEIKDARNILLLGEGRGRFLFEVVRQNPEAEITCVDASARMLDLTRTELEKRGLLNRPRSRPSFSSSAVIFEHEDDGRGRCVAQASKPAGSRDFPVPRSVLATPKPPDALPSLVRFIHTDIIKDNWDNNSDPYDAVASHFFLDCFRPEQLAQICSKVAACTAPGAPWLISDFRLPDRGWRHLRACCIVWGMYQFFRVVTALPASRLTDPDPLMTSAGFRLRTRAHLNHRLLHSDVWVRI